MIQATIEVQLYAHAQDILQLKTLMDESMVKYTQEVV